MNNTIDRKDVESFIKGIKGVFSVKFIKRTTNEERLMNCNNNVTNPKIPIKGVGLSFDPSKRGLIGVYDMQKQEYRFISIEGIIYIKTNGKTINVI